jgi:Ca2+-binding EF-hand superfamily protein
MKLIFLSSSLHSLLFITLLSFAYSQTSLIDRIKNDDVNQDGMVSREEFKGPTNVFEKLDKNHDGKLDPEEIKAASNGNGPQTPNNKGADPFDQSGQNQASGKVPDTLTYVKDVEYGKGGGKPDQ